MRDRHWSATLSDWSATCSTFGAHWFQYVNIQKDWIKRKKIPEYLDENFRSLDWAWNFYFFFAFYTTLSQHKHVTNQYIASISPWKFNFLRKRNDIPSQIQSIQILHCAYLLDLLGEFAGGCQNKSLALSQWEVNLLQQSNRECGSLAGTRLSLGNHIKSWKWKHHMKQSKNLIVTVQTKGTIF